MDYAYKAPYHMIRPEYQSDWTATNDSDTYVGYIQSPWNGQYFPIRDSQGYAMPPANEASWLDTVRGVLAPAAMGIAPYTGGLLGTLMRFYPQIQDFRRSLESPVPPHPLERYMNNAPVGYDYDGWGVGIPRFAPNTVPVEPPHEPIL